MVVLGTVPKLPFLVKVGTHLKNEKFKKGTYCFKKGMIKKNMENMKNSNNDKNKVAFITLRVQSKPI